jgi:hypothetical protein
VSAVFSLVESRRKQLTQLQLAHKTTPYRLEFTFRLLACIILNKLTEDRVERQMDRRKSLKKMNGKE